jgi:hypothetical protein
VSARTRYLSDRAGSGQGEEDVEVSGAIILAVGAVLFWYYLPRGGKTHRFVGTELEPYVALAFCVGVAMSFTLMLSGVIALREGR